MNFGRSLVLLLAAVIVTTAAFLVYDRLFADDASATRPFVTAPVERRTLRDSIVTRGTLSYEPAGTLLASMPGRVTALHVSTNDIVDAGQSLVSVNGRPCIAVRGSFPFWRDLSPGDTGPDVRQLEEALMAEGFDPGSIDDDFTFSTAQALRQWQELHAFPADGVFRAGDAFPATWPARVGAVRVAMGDFVSPGTSLLAITGQSLSHGPTHAFTTAPSQGRARCRRRAHGEPRDRAR